MKKIKETITREFKKLIELAFDEISAITAPIIVRNTYDRIAEENKKEYKKIADDAIEYALTYLEELKEEYGGTDLFFEKPDVTADEMVKKVLSEYNPVTGYLYERELQRKQERLAEGMITAKRNNDRSFYRDNLRTNANLLYTQSKQYADDVADQTVIEVWKRVGIKKIQWITERDDRVCSECRPLDGKIFDIDKVPPKPHYNCRCTKKPIFNR